VNKLEEQLRASRRTEVPGLQPPAGGWEAISGQLTAEAGTGASTAAGSATAKAVLIKWLTGLGGLLVIVAATFYVATTGTDSDTSPVTHTELVGSVPENNGTAISAANDLNTENQITRDATAGTVPDRSPAPRKATAVTIKTGTNTERSAAARNKNTTSDPRPAAGVKTSNDDDFDATKAVPSVSGIDQSKRSVGNSRNSPGRQTQPGGVTQPIRKTTTVSLPAPDTTNSPATGTAPRTVTPPPGTPESAVNDLTPGDNSTEPASITSVKPLFSKRIPVLRTIDLLADNLEAMLPLPTNVPDERTRRGKPKARKEWQLHGSISGNRSTLFSDQIFERVAAQQASRVFQLPGGDTVYGGFRRTARSNNIRTTMRLRAGLDRQLSSGFMFRSGIGLSHTYTSVDPGQAESLAPNEIRIQDRLTEWIVPVELSVQYTFLKRHRFRPYLGIGTFSTLFYSGKERNVFTEGLTDQSGLVEGRIITEFVPLYFDISVTAGFQYKITRDWSAGVYLWAGNDTDIFIDAPVGLEVRYTLK